MNDDGLEFGAVRESPPARRRRPDRDARYAVVACGRPAPADLPIFVELDAWRELIAHACDDVSVELGGVLLGGAYLDDDGRPFVWIVDGLRAEHFEATRGSFKFTHDTWSALTRRLADFPPDVRMAGWYHTHPDWGVFLSSMDLFICDHFFGKPLDVALVLDPCRADWGFFERSTDLAAGSSRSKTSPRRTGGFHLVAARHRRQELDHAAAAFTPFSVDPDPVDPDPAATDPVATDSAESGAAAMPADPRWSASSVGPSASPVIHLHQPPPPRPAVSPIALLLIVQTLLLAPLAWRAVAPSPPAPDATRDTAQFDRWLAEQRTAARLEAQAELMDRVLEELAASPDGSFGQMAELQEEKGELSGRLRAYEARERELVAEQAAMAKQAQADRRAWEARWETAGRERARLEKQLADQTARLERLTAQRTDVDPASLAGSTDETHAASDPSDSAAPADRWFRSPALVSAGIGAAAAIGLVAWRLRPPRPARPASERSSDTAESQES